MELGKSVRELGKSVWKLGNKETQLGNQETQLEKRQYTYLGKMLNKSKKLVQDIRPSKLNLLSWKIRKLSNTKKSFEQRRRWGYLYKRLRPPRPLPPQQQGLLGCCGLLRWVTGYPTLKENCVASQCRVISTEGLKSLVFLGHDCLFYTFIVTFPCEYNVIRVFVNKYI